VSFKPPAINHALPVLASSTWNALPSTVRDVIQQKLKLTLFQLFVDILYINEEAGISNYLSLIHLYTAYLHIRTGIHQQK